MLSIFYHVSNFFDSINGFINQLTALKVYDLGKSVRPADPKDKSHTFKSPAVMGDRKRFAFF